MVGKPMTTLAQSGLHAAAMLANPCGVHPISVGIVRIDGGTQSRAELNDDIVAEYAEKMKAGESFPAIVVFFDGSSHWLADGFHRLWAARRAELSTLLADVREGTKRDALIYSVGANSVHGLRRTSADKRHAVTLLLRDEQCAAKPSREVARLAGVSHQFVINVKAAMCQPLTDSRPAAKQVTRNGTTYVQQPKIITDKNGVARRFVLGAGRRHAEDQAKDIRSLVAEGHAREQIAEKLGVSKAHVSVIIKKFGIEVPGIRSNRIQQRRVIEETCNGLSGYAQGINTIRGEINGITAAEASQYVEELESSIQVFKRLVKTLRSFASSAHRGDSDALAGEVRTDGDDENQPTRAA